MENSKPGRTYGAAVRAHWRIALGVLALTLLASIGYLVLRSESYESSAEVLVTPLSSEQQNSLGLPLITESSNATRVSQTAAALLRSNRAANVTAEELGSGWDYNRVSGAIQIQPRGESNVIALTASADTPQLAARIANSYAEAALASQNEDLRRKIKVLTGSLEDEIENGLPSVEQSALEERIAALRILERTGNPTLSLSQRAIPPDASASPSKALVLGAALLGGAILAFGAALLIGALDTKIRRGEDLEHRLPLPIVAEIPRARRGRSRAEQAYVALAGDIEGSAEDVGIVMMTASSDVEDKSRVATRLALAARHSGRSVIFLDFDSHRRSSGRGRGNREIFGVARDDATIPRLAPGKPLSESLIQSPSEPHLWVGMPPGDGASLAGFSQQMPRLLSEARGDGALVIVEGPPLGEIGGGLRLLSQIDLALIVVQVGVSRRARIDALASLLGRFETFPGGVVLLDA